MLGALQSRVRVLQHLVLIDLLLQLLVQPLELHPKIFQFVCLRFELTERERSVLESMDELQDIKVIIKVKIDGYFFVQFVHRLIGVGAHLWVVRQVIIVS